MSRIKYVIPAADIAELNRLKYAKHIPTLTEVFNPTSTDEALREYGVKANEHHDKTKKAHNRALEHAKEAGAALIAAKNALGVGADRKDRANYGQTKGRWTRWLAEYFRGSLSTARLYMKVARNWDTPELRKARANGLEPKTLNAFASFVKKASEDKEPDDPAWRELKAKFLSSVQAELNGFSSTSEYDRLVLKEMVRGFNPLWADVEHRVKSLVDKEYLKSVLEKRRLRSERFKRKFLQCA